MTSRLPRRVGPLRQRAGSLVAFFVASAISSLFLTTALPKSVKAQADTDTAIGRRLFRQGVEAAEEQRWDDAVNAFERSYQVAPRPVTRYNLAGAQAEAGRLVAAIENYRAFIREATEERFRGHVEQARAALNQLEPRQANLLLEVVGLRAGDEILLDGRALNRAAVGVAIPIDPGTHEVSVGRQQSVERE